MTGRWVTAQDLFDDLAREEDALAFDRAGGHAYAFELTPPVKRTVAALDDEAAEEDEFALEDAALDSRPPGPCPPWPEAASGQPGVRWCP